MLPLCGRGLSAASLPCLPLKLLPSDYRSRRQPVLCYHFPRWHRPHWCTNPPPRCCVQDPGQVLAAFEALSALDRQDPDKASIESKN